MITAEKDVKETTDEWERFFRYLAAVAESWKLVLIVPLLIGALTYVYLVARPSLYRSDAILRLSKDELVVLKSDRVFGAKSKKAGDADSPEAEATAVLAVAPLDSPEVYDVTVTDPSAAGAAAILQGMIDRLRGETMPSEYIRTKSANRVKVLNAAQTSLSNSLQKINNIYDRLTKSEGTGSPLVFGGDYGLSGIIAAITINDKELSLIEDMLQPTFTSADVIQPPTVPTIPMARSVSPFVMLACVLSFAVLLLFVLVRSVLRTTASPNLIRVRRILLPWLKS